jgi:type IV pilus assembly protein PilB
MIESLKPIYNRSSHLGEQLVNDGLITQETLHQALVRQKTTTPHKFLGEILLQMGAVPAKTLGRYLEGATKCSFVELGDTPIDPMISQKVTELRARRLAALPFKDRGNDVLVAMSDPLNLGTVDELAALLGRKITPVLVFENDLMEAINRVFDRGEAAGKVVEEVSGQALPWESEDSLTVDDLISSAEDAPVVRLVNELIATAVGQGASDIHIEPQDGDVRVRYRVDGVLFDQVSLHMPQRIQAAVSSRIKIMCRADIAERRRPQDGRILFKSNGREHDLRVSILPTIYGEKIVMRILERNTRAATIEQIGFFDDQMSIFESFIERPHGMILVCGPTGSGKSTTLQAALQYINSPTLNISTVEDPVEYRVAGVNHTQVDPKIGYTFATGLRTLVRQDPDVIMVGEIRDKETAEIAINAALTGHLVFSTLHTNDAPGAITRLMNMQVEPFLIASSVNGVLGQRLVRKICANCREERPATSTEMEALGMLQTDEFSSMLAHGKGCGKCNNVGLKGREALFEVMSVSEEIRDLIMKRSSANLIHNMALDQGMKPMREIGVRKVRHGITTLAEVSRVLVLDES